MKYRWLLPGIFIVLVAFLFAFYIMGAGGHGPNPFDFVVYFLYPGCLLTGSLESVVGGPRLLWMLLCVLIATMQYFLLGYLIDLWVGRFRARKEGGLRE